MKKINGYCNLYVIVFILIMASGLLAGKSRANLTYSLRRRAVMPIGFLSWPSQR
jgi:hypothetical protein